MMKTFLEKSGGSATLSNPFSLRVRFEQDRSELRGLTRLSSFQKVVRSISGLMESRLAIVPFWIFMRIPTLMWVASGG